MAPGPAGHFVQRSVFPEPAPAVCVTFFTCLGNDVDGTADLQYTYASAISYLEEQRAAFLEEKGSRLPYELVWVDNGGDSNAHAAFLARGAQFEVARRNPTNEGLFRAVNDVWFRGHGCRARYVLSLEDDRVPRPDLLGSPQPHLALSIELLQHDATLAGVRLKDEWSDDVVSRAQEQALATANMPVPAAALAGAARYVPPLRQQPGARLRYARHCMALSSGFVWGSFSMAAVVYDRERLLTTVGELREGAPWDEMPYDYAEGQYAVRVGLAGLCTARPAFDDACSTLDHDNRPLRQPPPPGSGVAGSDVAGSGPCHQIFLERRTPHRRDLDDYRWFFHNVSGISLPELEAAAGPPPVDTASALACDAATDGATTRATGPSCRASYATDGSGSGSGSSPNTAAHAAAATAAAAAAAAAEPMGAMAGAVAGVVGEASVDDASVLGHACDGSPIGAATYAAFDELNSATRLAYDSHDYTEAAAAFRRLRSLVGGVEALIRRFECVGLSRFYAEHLTNWAVPPAVAASAGASATSAVASAVASAGSAAASAGSAVASSGASGRSRGSNGKGGPGGGDTPNTALGGDPRLERNTSATSAATSAASESTAPSAATSSPRARRTERPRQRRPRAEGITDWRDVPPPPPPPAPANDAVLGTRTLSSSAIPKILIQTWRELQLPAQFAELAERLRRAHPSWTYLLFDDQDIEAFVRARQPRWLPLFQALTYAPIQRPLSLPLMASDELPHCMQVRTHPAHRPLSLPRHRALWRLLSRRGCAAAAAARRAHHSARAERSTRRQQRTGSHLPLRTARGPSRTLDACGAHRLWWACRPVCIRRHARAPLFACDPPLRLACVSGAGMGSCACSARYVDCMLIACRLHVDCMLIAMCGSCVCSASRGRGR